MKHVIPLLVSVAICFGAELKLGKPLALKSQTAIADLNAKPASFIGKAVQVKGKVSEVCEMMGCWMLLVDPATQQSVKIKVKDGEIVFPKEAVGKMAVAEGTFAKVELTKEEAVEQLKHEAEANKKKFDPASVKGPMTVYQIQGTGAVVE